MRTKRENSTGGLLGALRQIESRSPETPTTLTPADHSPEVAELVAETPLTEPLDIDYACEVIDSFAEPGIGEAVEIELPPNVEPATVFTDPSFNRALDFADAVIAAADAADDDVEIWASTEVPPEEPSRCGASRRGLRSSHPANLRTTIS